MRRSFDGLCAMAENLMKQDPLSGHLFVFRNRNRDRLKILYWDSDGLAIWYKRLEKGGFQLPTDLKPSDKELTSAEISIDELTWLLGGVDLTSVKRRRRYSRPNKGD
jgi:transposase